MSSHWNARIRLNDHDQKLSKWNMPPRFLLGFLAALNDKKIRIGYICGYILPRQQRR
jgi:hypothetical protein